MQRPPAGGRHPCAGCHCRSDEGPKQAGFGLDAAGICLTDALQALCDLTGEDASDATIEEVFETFCVGKSDRGKNVWINWEVMMW